MKKTEQFTESKDGFKIGFGGLKVIDAEMFTNAIDEMIVLAKESAKATSPDCFLRIEIKANKELAA